MKLFSSLYTKTLKWSAHPHAPFYLAGVSFAESSVFPIPPDVMLIAMGLSNPKRAWRYALITTVFSILGAVLGYVLGMLALHFILPYLQWMGYGPAFSKVKHWFHVYGFWIIFIAGFSPIPYKVFTLAAGSVRMAFAPFMAASIIGRGLRFFLLAALLFFGGARLNTIFIKYIDRIGWILLGLLLLGYGLYRWI